jgi:hypothetical protein
LFNPAGNADFRQIITENADKYLTSKNSIERLCLTEAVIDKIETGNNGRFLRLNHLTGMVRILLRYVL